MDIIVLTPVRVLGDGLAVCFGLRTEISVISVVSELLELRKILTEAAVDLVLVDVTQGVDFYDIRSIALDFQDIALVALGLPEQRQAVVRCGRAGFTSYIAREATVDEVCQSLFDVVHGRLTCPAEISGGLFRALFHNDGSPREAEPVSPLTNRESEVLQLIGVGLSNKEIERELSLSIATVKHHVHSILEKLRVTGRAHAMRRVRDAPWIASAERGNWPLPATMSPAKPR
jgi:two-component system nitrate/nitrite response regulator NarL